MRKLFLGAICLAFTTSVHAADLDFSDGLTQGQVDGVIKDMGNVFSHSSMSSAQSLGTVFGMELGAYFNAADVPGFAAASDSNSKVDTLPMAGLYLAMSSAGFTGELNYLPSFDANGASFEFTSFGLKWTLPEAFNPIPMGTLAARIFSSSVDLGFTYQVVDSPVTNATLALSNSVTGIQGIWSQSFGVAEVYGGLGYLMGSGKMTIDAPSPAQPFDGGGNNRSSSPSSFQYMVGGQLNLFIFRLAAEYSNQFGASRTGLKFVFQF